MYWIAILTDYRIAYDRIQSNTGFKTSVVLYRLCSDHLNQLVGASERY